VGCGWVGRNVGIGGDPGPDQIACLGVEPNECSSRLVATVVEENPPRQTVHLAVI